MDLPRVSTESKCDEAFFILPDDVPQQEAAKQHPLTLIRPRDSPELFLGHRKSHFTIHRRSERRLHCRRLKRSVPIERFILSTTLHEYTNEVQLHVRIFKSCAGIQFEGCPHHIRKHSACMLVPVTFIKQSPTVFTDSFEGNPHTGCFDPVFLSRLQACMQVLPILEDAWCFSS